MSSGTNVRRIFISSSLRDLNQHREAAKRAVGKFQQVYDDFTQWTSRDGSPLKASLERVRSSDLFILIAAYRYGTEVPEHDGQSITHAEMRAAIAADIPVRAFFLDESYPWPVGEVDEDTSKIEALKKEAIEICTPAYFGSPESLEIEVCRCLLEILIEDGLKPRAEVALLVRPGRIEDLSAMSQDSFVIGKSIDGLPLVLKVQQDPTKISDLESQVSKLLKQCQIENQASLTATIIQGASAVARTKAIDRWETVSVTSDDTPEKCFVIQGTRQLNSVFDGILGGFLKKKERVTMVMKPPQTTVFHAPRGEFEPGEIRHRQDDSMQTARLGLGIGNSGKKYVFAWYQKRWKLRREFVNESLEGFDRVRYCIRLDPTKLAQDQLFQLAQSLTRQGATIQLYGSEVRLTDLKQHYNRWSSALKRDSGGVHLVFDDRSAYHNCLKNTDLHTALRRPDPPMRVYAEISTFALVDAVLRAAEQLAQNNSSVHGNIKPNNILVTDSGIRLVDGWNVEPGRSTAFTSDTWAPPEQAMGENIEESADVYSLCRVVVALLRLQISGEIFTYRMPKWDGKGDHDFKFVGKPYIQYHHDKEIGSFSDRHKLRELLSAGLEGRSKHRIQSVDELLDRFSRIKLSELNGWRRVSIQPEAHPHQLWLARRRYSACRRLEESVRLDPMIDKEKRSTPAQKDLLEKTMVFNPSMLEEFS